MKNIIPDFEVWYKDILDLPAGYQNITCHMIFDVKMCKKFRRKAWFVAGRHNTKTPAAINYSLVVSRELVWITLTIAALNNLDVLACNIQNANFMADCSEKVWVVAGPEFWSKAVNNMLVRKSLYELKIYGAAFRAFLEDTMDEMGYHTIYVNPYL